MEAGCRTQTLSDIASRTDIERLVDDSTSACVATPSWGRSLMMSLTQTGRGICRECRLLGGGAIRCHRLSGRSTGRAPRPRPPCRWATGSLGDGSTMFQETVGTLFHGPCADDVKARASRIAAVMQHHLSRNAAPSVRLMFLRTYRKKQRYESASDQPQSRVIRHWRHHAPVVARPRRRDASAAVTRSSRMRRSNCSSRRASPRAISSASVSTRATALRGYEIGRLAP